MLLPSYFIVDSDKYDSLPDVQLPEDTHLAYKISYDTIPLISTFYRKLFLSPKKYPFCLLIDISDKFDRSEAICELLVSFSFHSEYLRTNYDNPLILVEINKPGDLEYISVLREAFKSQGYVDIETVTIFKNNISLPEIRGSNVSFNLPENFANLSVEYSSAIKNLSSTNSSFCYFLNFPGELPGILRTIQEAESIVRKEMPLTYSLFSESKALKLKEKELRSKMEQLEERQESIEAYDLNYNSSIIWYKKQISELQKFYKLEYEILPLWYKRLGHIIKVLMGKRTFKSLYDDKVKKYKE